MSDAIRVAQAVLQAEADKLTAALAAKGFPGSHAEIWVGREGGKSAVVFCDGHRTSPPPVRYVPDCDRIEDAIADACLAISELPDPNAFDPWFVWTPQAVAAE